MLDFIFIAIPTGIVTRLAKGKGHDPVLFGMLTAVVAFICALIGAYFLGFVGDILGVFVGGIIVKEIVRNMPRRPGAKRQVYCPQCGFKQDRDENKLCERCMSPLRR